MADQPPSGQWDAPRPTSSVGAIVAASFLGVALVGLALFWQAAGWLADQIFLQLDVPQPWWIWVVVALILGVLAGVPSLLLTVIPRSPAVRETGRAWLCATGVAVLGGLLRIVPDPQNEAYLLVLAICLAAAAFWLRRRPVVASRTPGPVGLAIVAGLIVVSPWLVLGSLGGALETVLAVLAAAAAGWLASSILDGTFWATFAPSLAASSGAGSSGAGSGFSVESWGEIRPGTVIQRNRVVVPGLVAGVAFALIAAGLGASGSQLAAMFVLPPLGFAAAALGSSRPTGWLVGLAALGPLAFVDPDEITLFLLGRDIPFWTLVATAVSLAIGLVLALVLGLLPVRRTPRAVGWSLAALVVLASISLYAVGGRPGWHGERLFVVMKEQASLAGLPTTTGPGSGRDARVAAVYQRLVQQAERTQADLRKQLDRWGLSYTPYYLVNGIRVDGGPLVRQWLSARADVDRVLLDPVLRPVPGSLETHHGPLTSPGADHWNIDMVGAPAAWARGVTGSGIVIGSSDSGADGTHPALAENFRGGPDSWYDPWNGTTQPTDHDGHGTHTMATAVGHEGVGVAPGAQWIGCVNLARNMGSPSHYLDCLQFMLAPFPTGGNPFADGHPERAPNILTNSWGCPEIEGCDPASLRPAIDALAAAGIAVVVAAGNSGPRCGSISDPPSTYASAITVAAVDVNGRVADFSSRGDSSGGAAGKPDIAAPGQDVLSAMPGGTYEKADGTSMATPHVAGVIALLWSQDPSLIGDLAATRRRLASAARPATTSSPNSTSDSGSDSAGDSCGLANDVGAGIAQVPLPPR
ncbi:MAG: S8 family serine peptidase [Hamadaea sp.]|uniref:S8 family serine peptidase n=1 Tax=Hamadaea sp. TaxID=2024425 RepID=UPI0017EAC6FE|nr:S8 family serine peptidase [Hamadaea sp.]NUR73637.1 S8 family serine peptidase [Hamadaea sp.]NUT20352.1 S8 family serine peptidase [Hamadaea sp.]